MPVNMAPPTYDFMYISLLLSVQHFTVKVTFQYFKNKTSQYTLILHSITYPSHVSYLTVILSAVNQYSKTLSAVTHSWYVCFSVASARWSLWGPT